MWRSVSHVQDAGGHHNVHINCMCAGLLTGCARCDLVVMLLPPPALHRIIHHPTLEAVLQHVCCIENVLLQGAVLTLCCVLLYCSAAVNVVM